MDSVDDGCRGTVPRRACFRAGQLGATNGALDALLENRLDPYVLLRRHLRGDYGDLSATEQAANQMSLSEGGRILSRHEIGEADALWIVTERDGLRAILVLESEILIADHEQEYCEFQRVKCGGVEPSTTNHFKTTRRHMCSRSSQRDRRCN